MKLKLYLFNCFLIFCLIGKAQCPPELSVTLLSHTLTCYHPTLIATASSTTPNTAFSWTAPTVPSYISQPTIVIDISGPMIGFSPPFYTYTVAATNTLNSCSTVSIINIYYNFKPPYSNPIIISTPSFICNGDGVLLSKGNSTVTSGVAGASVIINYWTDPNSINTPTIPLTPTCNATSAGIYSLTIQDSFNGCYKTGTVNVTSSNPSFSLTGLPATNSVSCDASITINPESAIGYSVSASSGNLIGTPQNTITNLCYGKVIVCLTNTATACKKCDSLTIDMYTNIKRMNLEDEFILYPNPTNSTFYIKNTSQKGGTIKVFNVEGKEIESLVLDGMASRASTTDVTEVKNLNSGIYFVEIRIENSVVRKKVVVIR